MRATSRVSRGFTLVEILVVMVIIGVVIAGTLLSINSAGRDSELERERDRLGALFSYVKERGELQTAEYGLWITPASYQFMRYDNRTRHWADDTLDDALGLHKLPTGLDFGLTVEGRTVVVTEPKPQGGLKSVADEQVPQIMIFSSGETNNFELTLARKQAGRSVAFTDAADGTVTVGEMKVPLVPR